jgi:predicted helicase
MSMGDVIKSYLANIERELKTGRATEHTHRPALKDLLEGLDLQIKATNEPKRVECGAPDFVLRRDGLSVGYVETKDLGKSLDEAEDSEQLLRYRKSLPNLILTDYLEFRWFADGQLRESARLGRIGKSSKILPDKKGIEQTAQLLKLFLESRPEPITTPKELSERAAKLAHIIRDTIVEAFEKDKASQDLRDLRDAFADVLIPDLNKPEKVAEFADMYAQTIVYGLFAARCNHPGPGPFQRLGAAREIPKTNPFLKKLFETITGSSLDEEPYVDFVDDLVQVLAYTHIEKVLENFGKRTRQEDPIVHFYETFLAAYDPKTRERRGVYYTPEPVVQYIVKSVDHILKTRFGLEGGLAHTADIVEYDREEAFLDEQGRPDRSKLLKTVREERPRVLILDPACGTGTFLYAVMDFIRAEFMKRGDAGLWSAYVRDHLLPRLFGFELLMAPYAMAHFKLGMLLAGYDLPKEQQRPWRYNFEADERLGIYLTNTLDEAPSEWQKLFGAYRILSEEANAASRVKRDLPIMVVLGNPPYSANSANKGNWIIDKVRKSYYPNDEIKEQNPKLLLDDYVKFIRWGQWRIGLTGRGILAFITNHGYLDNPTFRGMRKELMKAFNDIYILDLHGSVNKKERSPDGSDDENVFDIQQGVAIGIFIRDPRNSNLGTVYHAELWGNRDKKYEWLGNNSVNRVDWNLVEPRPPFYLFRPQDTSLNIEYEKGWKITDVMPVYSTGVKTHRDHFALDFDIHVLEERIMDFRNLKISDAEIGEKYDLHDTRDWKMSQRRIMLAEDMNWEKHFTQCLYRPFDYRSYYHDENIVELPRMEVMDNLFEGDNLGLVANRQIRDTEIRHNWVSRKIIDFHILQTANASAYIFPLYIKNNSEKLNQQLLGNSHLNNGKGKKNRAPNIDQGFIVKLQSLLRLRFVSDGHGDLAATFGPEDVFDYIYAVFHSPTYRQRYAEFLKIDFPRVPLTSNLDLFRKLCALGEELVALHLLESPQVTQLITRYPVAGDNLVEKGFPKFAAYEEGQPGYVYINKTQYFEGVPKEVWEFHVGGYQVCEKWLKDRRMRKLSFDDLMHYQKVIVALRETMRLMEEIDRAIPGWPIE